MGKYAAVHVDPQGAGDARPTALQIIEDEGIRGKLAGKVIVITGTSSGLGIETARALSATGATLFLTVRNLQAAEAILSGILEPGRVSLVHLDNSSFASTRAGAETILSRSNNQVNIIVNNAGVLGLEQLTLSEDGHETHFQTNYLSHFLLFQLLKPVLLASSTPAFHSRVVNVSSSASRAFALNQSDNYDFEKGGYNHFVAYSQSKSAQIYMSNEIDRRYAGKGLHATSIHPGSIATNLSRHLGPEFVATFFNNKKLAKGLKTAEQGAATTVIAAVGKEWGDNGGRYLEDCEEAKRGEDDGSSFGVGYVSWTYDPEAEARLWKDSLEIVGISE